MDKEQIKKDNDTIDRRMNGLYVAIRKLADQEILGGFDLKDIELFILDNDTRMNLVGRIDSQLSRLKKIALGKRETI